MRAVNHPTISRTSSSNLPSWRMLPKGRTSQPKRRSGPLAAIFNFDTERGLAGYLFSKDIGTILRVARKLECGLIGVNTGLISAGKASLGGIKESSVSRDGSRYMLYILSRQPYVRNQSFVLIWFCSLLLPTISLQTLSIASAYLRESLSRCAQCTAFKHFFLHTPTSTPRLCGVH